MEKKIGTKLKEFIETKEFKEAVRKALNDNGNEVYSSKIVTTEQELIRLSNKGYDCIPIAEGKWLMRKNCN